MLPRAPLRHLAALALLAATAARAAPVEIAWDAELAFEHDRERYQRAIRDLAEDAYARASSGLGLTLQRPVKVQVFTPAHYQERFGSVASATQGAHYQRSAIYMNGGSRLGDWLAGGLVHEMAHALIDHAGTGHRVPLWLNEGLAERLAWSRRGLESLAPNQREEIQYAGRRKMLVPLSMWNRARLSYLHSWAAVLFVEQKFGRAKLLSLLRRALAGEPWERALDRELGTSQADLERDFAAWVERLS